MTRRGSKRAKTKPKKRAAVKPVVPVVIVWLKGREHRVPIDEARVLVAQVTENIRRHDALHVCACCPVHNQPMWIDDLAVGDPMRTRAW